MAIKSRLKRLENAVGGNAKYHSIWDFIAGKPVPKGFDPARDLDPRHLEAWHLLVTIPVWLEERGFPDCLAAVEAGESGPAGLEDLVRERAGYDRKDRAWQRIEAAWHAGKLSDDADLEILHAAPGLPPTLDPNATGAHKDTDSPG